MRFHAALVMLICGTALGQNALDKPLDRNTRVGGSGSNYSRPDLGQELRLRNAIVTGNAPGGFSFRGDVGYRAPGEFFGSLGSNETFSFRRDSYYSGLGGMGIRGTDALQYQFAMTTGNAPPPGFMGAPTFSRSAAAVPVRAVEGPGERITRDSALRRDVGDEGSMMSLRSPSSFAASRSLEPMVLGQQRTPDGRTVGISASPLLGLAVTEQQSERTKAARDSVTEQKSGHPAEAGKPGEAGKPDTGKESPNGESTKVNTSASPSAYEELMVRIKAGVEGPDNPADPSKERPAWQAQLDELRKQLGSSPTNEKPTRVPTSVDPRPVKPGDVRPGEIRPGEGRPGDARPGEGRPGENDPKRGDPELEPTAIERIRNAAGNVRDLAAKGFDGYAEHMAAAQQYLSEGRFFFAEERFTAALSLKAGDPMAAIGRVHAQLGAGMFVSATINLRSLFAEHPEVVSLKYQAHLLPPAERLDVIEERLSELAAARDGKQRDLGLLIAYLGFQRGKAATISKGLALMAEPPQENPGEGPDQLQKLGAMLAKVWLAPASAPTPAASPAATPPGPPGEPNK